jgi:hypothetical protein
MKKFLFYTFLLVAILLALYIAPAVKSTNFYEKALPLQLQTTGFVTAGSDVGFLDILAREACGAVVFNLAPETIETIKRDGLSFFDGATQGRGYPTDHYYHYGPWQQTPTPSTWFGEGIVAGSLSCANLSPELRRRIREGSLRPGSFYSIKPEAQLIVLPDEGLVVFTYFG